MKMSVKLLLLATAACVSEAAMAQSAENGPGLDEIVVTAQRRSESLQKVPLAVTALDSKALEARGLTNLNNLATAPAPGVVITQFAGTPSTLAFNIRGAYSNDPGIGLAEQGVAVYSDGVPLGRAVGTGIELGDIERIELLRGPQGTLFGRNAEGGAVQFITKRPKGELGGRVEGTVGNFDQRRVTAVLDLPKFANISIKLSGLIDKHDGWTRNLQPRTGLDYFTPGIKLPSAAFVQERSGNFENLGLKDQRGFRAAVLWQPAPNLSAYYTYDYSDLNYTVSYNSRTGGRVPSEAAFCVTSPASCADFPTFLGNIFYGTVTAQPINPAQADVATYTPQSSNHIRGHGLTLEYNASDSITLKSISGLRFVREEGFTNLGSAQIFVQTVPVSDFASNIGGLAGFSGTLAPARINQKQFSSELQMIGDFGDLKLTTGLFYYYERVVDTRSSFFALGYRITGANSAVPVAIDPFDINGVSTVDGLPNSLQKFLGVAHSYAAYAQGTWTPSNIADGKLSLTAGLRYTKDKKEFFRLRAAAGATGSSTSVFDKDRFDPAVTVAYQANPDLNIYARFARAYRAGGTGIRNKLSLTTYRPEVNTSYELGLKSQLLDNRVRFNVAAFHSVIKDSQVSFQNSSTDPSSTDTINVKGNIKIDGVEVETLAQVTRELSFNLGYSWMKADLKGVTVTGPVATLSGTTILSSPIISQPYLPRHQLNVGVDYVRPVGDAEAFFHGEYNYMSKQNNAVIDYPNAAEAQRSLSQFNARLGVRKIPLGGATMGVELWGKNILNKREFSYAYQIGSSDPSVDLVRMDPGGSGYPTEPRTYGITARVEF